jgi:hypothetical protein
MAKIFGNPGAKRVAIEESYRLTRRPQPAPQRST